METALRKGRGFPFAAKCVARACINRCRRPVEQPRKHLKLWREMVLLERFELGGMALKVPHFWGF
ncbi:hypothetical protein [Agrobacterium deltaense]|uniref:hypothetical protein n=1 Tax=Agrobacterium deltaense TaxID=1183412 RepID=UPI000F634221|nr:hypothetical protein [Agrobacterium deltaense]RRN75987.1 hypothetical protein EIQ31_02595 [Agrobacterium deltaense]